MRFRSLFQAVVGFGIRRAPALRGLLFIFLSGSCLTTTAQTTYSIDASAVSTTIKTGQLRMGNPGPPGKEILINNRYMTLAGKPVLPVMGEAQFSRIPQAQWEDVLLKMKACGITIISCYVFWNHHEEIEGQFDWSDNKDLHAFAQLCAKHGLWLYPRIGPWVHGEARNGGTPDWILKKLYLQDRTNDPVYQHYAEEWYKQVAMQLKGLLYKDGGPVIGVQLENEYARGKAGEPHIAWLKETALKNGIDVPMYSVTGWGDGSVPDHEVIPFWGTYPDAPWNTDLNRKTTCDDYRFIPYRNDEKIGDNLAKATPGYINYSDFPYFTCEMGVGIENTNHRRLQIGEKDGVSLIMSKLGSGANLIGYYVFAGGSNPHGELTAMGEDDNDVGSANINPYISYDFQAAIRESGELNKSYYEIKKLHYFLNEFGDQLAPMEPVFPADQKGLQYVVRIKDKAGFLFGMNYCRNNVSSEKKNVQFNIKLKGESLTIPSIPVDIKDSDLFVWPFNLPMHNVLLKYATAQPVCHIGDKWVFAQDVSAAPEFCFDATTVNKLESVSGSIAKKDGKFLLTGLRPGLNGVITVNGKDGSVQKIILLSKEEAKQVWLFSAGDKKRLFISDAAMYMNGEKLHFFGASNNITVSMLNTSQNTDAVFDNYSYSSPAKKPIAVFTILKPLDHAQWLQTSGSVALNNGNLLIRRYFEKEFSLGNPSTVSKATLFLSTQSVCRLRVNNVWVNQHIVPDATNLIDLTGYVRKGENELRIDFPSETVQKAFAAKLRVEYFNMDRIEFGTDQSWLFKDSYNQPSTLVHDGGFQAPVITKPVELLNKVPEDCTAYTVNLPADYLAGLNNLYMTFNYTGDKARLYADHRLVADDFSNGDPWSIGLNRYRDVFENHPPTLEIYPLAPDARVYFDDEAAKQAAVKAALTGIQLRPEYKVDVEITASGLRKIE